VSRGQHSSVRTPKASKENINQKFNIFSPNGQCVSIWMYIASVNQIKLMGVIFDHIVLLYSSDVIMKTQKFYNYYEIPGIYYIFTSGVSV